MVPEWLGEEDVVLVLVLVRECLCLYVVRGWSQAGAHRKLL